MSHERQQRVIKNFDSYNKVENPQMFQHTQPTQSHAAPPPVLPKHIQHFGLNKASRTRGSELKIVHNVFR
jgi:hypothetical protein